GQDAEEVWCGGESALDVLRRAGDQLVLGLWRVGHVGVQGSSVRGGVVAEAGCPADLTALVLDRGKLVESDLVDVVGVEIERRPAPDGGPVQLLAVRGGPDPGLLPA